MRPARLLAMVAVASLALGAASAVAEPLGSQRQQAYTDAGIEFGVPASVLLGVSYMESRWDANAGTPSTAAGYGPMHLTDVTTANAGGSKFEAAGGDARGDDARPMLAPPAAATPVTAVPQLQTVDLAATLTGADKATLRADPAQNIRGGAALLAKYQKDLGIASTNPADWYGAVARYSGSDDSTTAASFADDVFSTITQGVDRVTDDGQHVTLQPAAVQPNTAQLGKLGLRGNAPGAECPANLGCDWVPAGYGQFKNTYGNHDLGDRPASQKIDYIVIHDTEGQWDGVLDSIKKIDNPSSWQYSIRSSDGHVAQHVQAKDVAWQAGNWYVNSKSIGIEHEGFAAAQGKWYTESLYRSSSRLVRYLAAKYQVPLNRQHIIGHDNVPGITPPLVHLMHWDPGPYWDWTHYFDLLGAPVRPTGNSFTGMVTIRPDYDTNQPAFTGCTVSGDGKPCVPHGSGSVILHTEPRQDAPLLLDAGLHTDGGPTTMDVSDHGSRVETGQQYAVADQSGSWTAIWYLGQKGWFYNPHHSVGLGAMGLVVTPKPGKATIPVYGRAYPEASAYPAGVPVQALAPLQYTFAAGQRYVLGGPAPAEYYYAVTFDTPSHTVVKGTTKYLEIQFGHRVMFVNAADVNIWPSFLCGA
ncbi:N-acetylmuramoyl-L-alanine amidase [Actinocrispum wychmicini]|uniref:N-acetylmuramoyl-L-alanine amidase n=1 Tax=Actinocrispum wychmicini TaxID=1213861 RepID=A0A4R2JXV3_9PSEU|nr:N-acetylmuramoyl-L-alanine amidase [Actinocrispum wychmicini]TCO65421.1 N-acetylmuramoyl-L-alanine amidase [Actinocrispum wychmicini]